MIYIESEIPHDSSPSMKLKMVTSHGLRLKSNLRSTQILLQNSRVSLKQFSYLTHVKSDYMIKVLYSLGKYMLFFVEDGLESRKEISMITYSI